MTSTQAVTRVTAPLRCAEGRPCRHARPARHRRACRLPSGKRPRPCPSRSTATSSTASRVRFGEATDTDDSDGTVIATSDRRPSRAEIEAALPSFVGEISQVPPRYSALKVAGARAYDLAREDQDFELAAAPRPDRKPRADRHARPRSLRDRGALRQGHLCAGAWPATLERRSAASPMSRNCAERGSGLSAKRPQFPWQSLRS